MSSLKINQQVLVQDAFVGYVREVRRQWYDVYNAAGYFLGAYLAEELEAYNDEDKPEGGSLAGDV